MSSSKDKILRAASALLLADGLHALSVRAIAQRAAISTMGIYHHFQGKQGILDALTIEGFGLLSAAISEAESVTDSEQRLLAGCQGYLQVAQDYEAHYRLMFGELGDQYQPSKEAQAVAVATFLQLRRAVAGVLPEASSPERQQQAALQVWAQLHGYVSLKQQALAYRLDTRDWQQQVLRAMRTLIAGLQRPS